MKNIKSIFRSVVAAFFVLTFFMMCVSCTDDEPKLNKESTSDTDDGHPGRDTENKNIDIKYLASGSWLGRYYPNRQNHQSNSKIIDVKFVPKDAFSGTGTMTVEKHNGSYVTNTTKYELTFEIIDNEIKCFAEKDGVYYDMLFEFREGLLYMDAPDIASAFLGKDKEVFSDIEGLMVDKSILVYKVWLHENGRNILDFRLDTGHPARVVQLIEPESVHFNYNDYGNHKVYNYVPNKIKFSFAKKNMAWNIIELTEDKMVLKGYNDECEHVYYAASPDIVPKEYGPANISMTPWCGGGL